MIGRPSRKATGEAHFIAGAKLDPSLPCSDYCASSMFERGHDLIQAYVVLTWIHCGTINMCSTSLRLTLKSKRDVFY